MLYCLLYYVSHILFNFLMHILCSPHSSSVCWGSHQPLEELPAIKQLLVPPIYVHQRSCTVVAIIACVCKTIRLHAAWLVINGCVFIYVWCYDVAIYLYVCSCIHTLLYLLLLHRYRSDRYHTSSTQPRHVVATWLLQSIIGSVLP